MMAVHVFPTVNDIGSYPGMGKTISEANLTALIKALLAQNFVVSGFTVPSSDADLILPVAAGEAIISGYRVVIDTSTDVTCTASATNYIFLKLTRDALGNVTGAIFEVNTTASIPPDSVKIATAVAGASSITSTQDQRTTDGFWFPLASGSLSVAANSEQSVDLGYALNTHRFYMVSVYCPSVSVISHYKASTTSGQCAFYIIKAFDELGQRSDRLVLVNGTNTALTMYYKVMELKLR